MKVDKNPPRQIYSKIRDPKYSPTFPEIDPRPNRQVYPKETSRYKVSFITNYTEMCFAVLPVPEPEAQIYSEVTLSGSSKIFRTNPGKIKLKPEGFKVCQTVIGYVPETPLLDPTNSKDVNECDSEYPEIVCKKFVYNKEITPF